MVGNCYNVGVMIRMMMDSHVGLGKQGKLSLLQMRALADGVAVI